MPRYVVRFNGQGAAPAAARAHIRRQPDTKVLDESERMVLIDAPENVADALRKTLPDCSVSQERVIPLPKKPRPKLRGG
jgi:hypothetical protein